MANVQNSFIRSKLNKDLDARLIPNGEYRDARNVQVSRSEGSNVGSLENVLGNKNILNFENITGEDDMVCIGHFVSEPTNEVYLFLTSYTDPNPSQLQYSTSNESYIIVYNSLTNEHTILVTGRFLNFSTTHEIYHVNLLEELLFWTDNRNQPRKINVTLANPSNLTVPTYYATEDQISVAKYNPFQPIQLWQKNTLTPQDSVPYETTMKDVNSKALPNGATATTLTNPNGNQRVFLSNLVGEVPLALPYGAASVSYVKADGSISLIGVVALVQYQSVQIDNRWDVTLASGTWPNTTQMPIGTELVFNANPYYNKDFAGDPNFLEDKFVRFSYRFKFDDNEYSLMAPFTQVAFIPKQDGYFMYVQDGARNYTSKDNQSDAYRSTVVSFVENKVDAIKLLIPLPFTKTTIAKLLKITELDILYKESDALAIKVIETIGISELTSGADSSIFEYDYLSKKPYKVLPSSDTTRVYDRVPVRAFAQESSGNRIIYGNFQTKHTPPTTLDYNVAVDAKANFNLQTGTAAVNGAQNINANVSFNIDNWVPFEAGDGIIVGMIVSITSSGAVLGTVSAVTSNTSIKINAAINIADNVALTFNPAGPDSQTVSKIEYPNHSIKQNRNYQVGVVLSDRYGRTSTVILSRSNSLINGFRGDTIYSPYLSPGVEQDSWPGESLKMLFNSVIGPSTKNVSTGEPGLYNSDVNSTDYNPLGWYSYKIVVKQTEQEYYNVYLPGIMASYPESQLLELGKTSHTVLLNDNINKVPRDLTEVGPDQKQFRSSVQLFGRVENTAILPAYNTATPPNPSAQDLTNAGALTDQYYPGTSSDTVSTISTLYDIFDFNPTLPPVPNYFGQFYLNESNPLIARISTSKQIGQAANINYNIASATVVSTAPQNAGFTTITCKDLRGTLVANMIVSGIGVPEDTTIVSIGTGTPITFVVTGNISLTADDKIAMVPGFPANFLGDPVTPPIQYLAVYETEPVESLLDIFWESTSTGEVNELNTLILNATGGGAGLINTSTSDWDESKGEDYNIFNQNFQVIDSFGTPILPGGSPVELISVTLDSVINGVLPVGTDVQFGGGPNAYFELVNLGSGLFNIKLKPPYVGQGAGNGIYFSQDSEVRNFRFNIIAVTEDADGNQTSNTYAIDAGPSNVTPFQATPGITTQPTLSGTINSNRLITDIATCIAANGASKGDLKAGGVSWSVFSAFETDASSNYPDGADLATNDAGPALFSATNTEIIVGANTLAKGVIKLNTSVAPAKYNIIVRVQDAGGAPPSGTDFSFLLDLVIVPTSFVTQGFTYCTNPLPGGGCGQGDGESTNIVAIEVTTSAVNSQNGFYMFDIGNIEFDGEPGWSSLNGDVITLNRTNAVTTANAGQPLPSDIPAFAATFQLALDILDKRNFNDTGDDIPPPQSQTISDYVFEIV